MARSRYPRVFGSSAAKAQTRAAFSAAGGFFPIIGATLGVAIESNLVTLANIGSAVPLTISGGSYSKNGGAYSTTATTVSDGDTIKVRVTAPSSNSATATAAININGTARTFSVTTADPVIVTPTPTPTPTLALSPASTSIASSAAAGTLVTNITNVPAGVSPSVTPNDGRLVIAGDASAGWKVVVGMTAISAGDLAFSVAATGANGAGGVLTVKTAALPTVSISAAQSKSEGNSDATLFTYTVTRSATSGAVNVPWAFAAGGTSADDFTGGTLPAGGSVAMADGVATGTFSVSVNGDSVVEGDESFTVSIAAPSGYTLGTTSSATGTIVNDDASGGQAGVFQSIGIMTDLDSDVDDVVAFALAFNMAEDAGLAISYVSVGSRHEYSAHAARVLLNAANRASVPVCQIQTPELANSKSIYAAEVAALLQPVKLRAEYPSSVSVTRAVLAAMPDKSHKIVTMGCLTDYAALLASPADGISPLTGRELVAAKVISVHPMAGTYPNSTAFGPNTNDDWEASNATAKGPVPVYWAIGPLGGDIYTSIPTNGIDPTDPYRLAWDKYNNGGDRASWDSMPVIHAVLGNEPYFVQSEPQDVDFTVGTAWTPNAAGNNYYMSRKVNGDILRDVIDRNVNNFMVKYAKKTAPYVPVAPQTLAQARSLKAEYGFYETTGRTAVSFTGKNNADLLTNASFLTFPPRLISPSMASTGVQVPASEDFAGISGLFIAVILVRQMTQNPGIMNQDSGSFPDRAWSYRFNGNKQELYWRGGATVTITDTTALVASKWQMVAVWVKPDRSVVFYTNGVAGGGGTLHAEAVSPLRQPFVISAGLKGWTAYAAVHKGDMTEADVLAQHQRARDVAASKNIILP